MATAKETVFLRRWWPTSICMSAWTTIQSVMTANTAPTTAPAIWRWHAGGTRTPARMRLQSIRRLIWSGGSSGSGGRGGGEGGGGGAGTMTS